MLGINRDGSTHFQVLTIKGSHKTWDIPNGQRVVCDHNNASQPVGFSALKFRRMTGKIIRSRNYVNMGQFTEGPATYQRDYLRRFNGMVKLYVI